jgi:ectoine hydroxylase-related dioxygenase (phytanoyl-CoA dioxygenase family)
MVSSAEVEKYKADGQITSGVRLRPEVVTELREKMERFFEAQPGVDQDYAANLIDQDNSWLKYAMMPEILDIVTDLIGDDIIVWGSALFAKKGKGGKLTPWHQDGHYWPIRPLATVTAWIAIDDVDTANGCLRVIPGSHSAQELQDHYTEDSPDVVLNQALEVGDDRFGKPRDVELKAGEFSIHDVYLIHGAAKNDSGRRRAGLVFRYMPTTSHFDRDLACKQAQEMNVPDLSNRQLHLVSGVDRSGKNDVRRN